MKSHFLNAVFNYLESEYVEARKEFIKVDSKCKSLERLLGMCVDEMNRKEEKAKE